MEAPLVSDAEGNRVNPAQSFQDALARKRDRRPPEWPAAWQFGCIPNRRREEAALIQAIHSYELSAAHCYHVTTFYDGRNAFWSLHHEGVLNHATPPFVATNREHTFIAQRVRYAVVRLGKRGAKQAFLLVKSGVIPGDHAGPKLFNNTIDPAGSRAARRHRLRTPCPELLRMTSFLLPSPIQVSYTGFVDDMASKAAGTTWRKALTSKLIVDEEVTSAMQDIGVAMNDEKQENVVEGPPLT